MGLFSRKPKEPSIEEKEKKARDEFKKLVFDKNFSDFLTLPAYQLIS